MIVVMMMMPIVFLLDRVIVQIRWDNRQNMAHHAFFLLVLAQLGSLCPRLPDWVPLHWSLLNRTSSHHFWTLWLRSSEKKPSSLNTRWKMWIRDKKGKEGDVFLSWLLLLASLWNPAWLFWALGSVSVDGHLPGSQGDMEAENLVSWKVRGYCPQPHARGVLVWPRCWWQLGSSPTQWLRAGLEGMNSWNFICGHRWTKAFKSPFME